MRLLRHDRGRRPTSNGEKKYSVEIGEKLAGEAENSSLVALFLALWEKGTSVCVAERDG